MALISGVGLCFEILDSLADRLNFFGLLVRDRHVEFFFEFHNEFHRVERVGAEVLDEVRFVRHFIFVYAQFVDDDFLYAFGYSCHDFIKL